MLASPDSTRPSAAVVIVCRVRIVRDSLTDFLGARDVCVVGAADGAEGAIAEIRRREATVALVDMSQGVDTVRQIAQSVPQCRVVVLGVPEEAGEVVEWIQAGACAYVPHAASGEAAQRVLNRAIAGEVALPPAVVNELTRRLHRLRAETGPSASAALTKRELEILQLVEQGFSNKEIARHLTIELSTVKNHVHNLLQKLHVHRRAEASAWLRRRDVQSRRRSLNSGD